MRKTGLLILLVAALIGCPPPGEDELFNNINIADWVTFADGDSISSVTQSFTVAAEKDGYTATVKAPSTMTVEGNTVSVNPINIYAPSQEAILTITLTKNGVSKQFPLTVTLKRTLGSIPVEQLIRFEESLDTIDAVTKNFTLAQDTGDWGEDVSWVFDTDSENLVYEESTGEVTVTLTDEQQTATATATFTKEGFESVTKTYEITVLTQNEGFSWTPDSLTDYIKLGNGGKDYLWRIRDNFELTTEIPADSPTHGAVTVSWSSSNEDAISISEGNATVTRALDSQKVTLTAAFKEESRREKSLTVDVLVMETIPNTLEVDGKTYNLVYFDAFDNQAILEANWDIGNPGHDAPEIGNNDLEPTYFKAPDEQFHGYADEWQKQPTWSPKATYIEDGKARLLAKYDKEAQIGVAGALHSKRLFPHGVFHARWTQKRDTNSHWDAFWLDTNQPFSKAYGQKLLNLPKALRSQVETTTEGFFDNQAKNIQHGNTTVNSPILYQSAYTLKTTSTESWNFTAAPRVDEIGRWYNGEQRYEIDAYEWTGGNTQNNVIHTWHWMRGYPGNQTGEQNGVDKKWFVGDVARNNAKVGGYSTVYYKDVNKTPSFTLTTLYNDSKIAFYYNAHGESNFTSPTYSRSKKDDGTFDNTAMKPDPTDPTDPPKKIPDEDNYQPWPDDEFNPVQVKFTIEPGQWNDNFFQITTEFQNKPDEFDAMDLEYFAYYAAEDDMLNPNIGDADSDGVTLTAITDMDNVLEDAATQEKLTKEWVQK